MKGKFNRIFFPFLRGFVLILRGKNWGGTEIYRGSFNSLKDR